ncbi:conserved hypothetical protein [Ricinus communis]|uniref:Uncharacterized protein n=1 Tax=Ricinus communis TaxID=3988 RepID=B9RPS6_RICCO|nr:conserved hypothetical protein [Ricinus communis]
MDRRKNSVIEIDRPLDTFEGSEPVDGCKIDYGIERSLNFQMRMRTMMKMMRNLREHKIWRMMDRERMISSCRNASVCVLFH